MIRVNKIKEINLLKLNSSYGMANSISFFNNKFLVTFGSNILSIICYDKLELIKSIGGLGLSKYSFREPVFGRFDSEIYVCDWHNNRVVIYDKI